MNKSPGPEGTLQRVIGIRGLAAAIFNITVGAALTTLDPNPVTVTPEPVTLTLLGTGLAGMGLARRRRR